jgi:hypothetical protein
MVRQLSPHDQRELDAFRRLLAIRGWREKELGESRYKALGEACLEIYGDKNGQGSKHHEGFE